MGELLKSCAVGVNGVDITVVLFVADDDAEEDQRPSGDQSGRSPPASRSQGVSWCSPDPLALMMKSALPPTGSASGELWTAKTICLPFGDHMDPPTSAENGFEVVMCVTWRRPPPFALMTKISLNLIWSFSNRPPLAADHDRLAVRRPGGKAANIARWRATRAEPLKPRSIGVDTPDLAELGTAIERDRGSAWRPVRIAVLGPRRLGEPAVARAIGVDHKEVVSRVLVGDLPVLPGRGSIRRKRNESGETEQ